MTLAGYVSANFEKLLSHFGGGGADGSWIVRGVNGDLHGASRERGSTALGPVISQEAAEVQMARLLQKAFKVTPKPSGGMGGVPGKIHIIDDEMCFLPATVVSEVALAVGAKGRSKR